MSSLQASWAQSGVCTHCVAKLALTCSQPAFLQPPHSPRSVLRPLSPLQDLTTCEQSGRDLSLLVKRRLKNKERGSTSSMAAVAASGAQLAMGRVVGSLCVVASRDEEAVSAMLASWVSQVSWAGSAACHS